MSKGTGCSRRAPWRTRHWRAASSLPCRAPIRLSKRRLRRVWVRCPLSNAMSSGVPAANSATTPDASFRSAHTTETLLSVTRQMPMRPVGLSQVPTGRAAGSRRENDATGGAPRPAATNRAPESENEQSSVCPAMRNSEAGLNSHTTPAWQRRGDCGTARALRANPAAPAWSCKCCAWALRAYRRNCHGAPSGRFRSRATSISMARWTTVAWTPWSRRAG